MKGLRLMVGAAVLMLAPSMLLARIHPFGDAGLNLKIDRTRNVDVVGPPEIQGVLEAKCADCHSSQPHVPIYGHFAPISWLLERDIVEARKEMDLSDWTRYTPEQQETLRAKIVQEARSGGMPLLPYRLLHWKSTLTTADVQRLATWAHSSEQREGAVGPIAAGDAVRGQSIFARRCTGCHTLTNDREGPRLGGVYGRRAGSVAGFHYSAALRDANVTWDAESLERWLTEPDDFIANSNMDFRVPKAQERRDLISFFEEQRGR